MTRERPRRQVQNLARKAVKKGIYQGRLAEEYDGIGQYVLVSLSMSSVAAAARARVAAGDFGTGQRFPVGTPVSLSVYRGKVEILSLGNKNAGVPLPVPGTDPIPSGPGEVLFELDYTGDNCGLGFANPPSGSWSFNSGSCLSSAGSNDNETANLVDCEEGDYIVVSGEIQTNVNGSTRELFSEFTGPANPPSDDGLTHTIIAVTSSNSSVWTAFEVTVGPAPAGTVGWRLSSQSVLRLRNLIVRAPDTEEIPGTEGTPGPSLGGPGEEAFGDSRIPLPSNSVIEHDDLSDRGGIMHDITQIGSFDVESVPPVDGQALVYDETSEQWVPGDVASGAPEAHAASHQSGGGDPIKLDDLATPDDNTDLNASTTRHGLLRKLSNVATEYLDGSGAWSTPAGGGGGGGAPVGDRVHDTATAIFTTSSTSFVDVPPLTRTITLTAARRVLVIFTGTGDNTANTGRVDLDIAIDGVRQGIAAGMLAIGQHATASEGMNLSFVYLTDVLAAGSHTFKLQVAAPSGTVRIYLGGTGVTAHFAVIEQAGGGSSGSPASGSEIRRTSHQSIPHATWTDIAWEAEEYDDASYWSVGNAGRITFAEAGRYLIIPNPIFAVGTGSRGVRVVRNADDLDELAQDVRGADTVVADRMHTIAIVNAAAGEYVRVQAYQSSGAALNLEGYGSIGDHIETSRVFVARLHSGFTPFIDFSQTHTASGGTSNRALHTRTLTGLAAGTYRIDAKCWVVTSQIGTLYIRAAGVEISNGTRSDPRNGVGQRNLFGYYVHAGGDVTFDLYHLQESGTTVYGVTSDTRFASSLMIQRIA